MHDFLDDIRSPFSCRGFVRRIRLLAFALPITSCLSLPAASADTALQIYVIDVAQGDSTLVVGPGRDGKRATLLIDAGDFRGTDGASLVERVLEIAGVEHLDHVVLSHYDADHMGGFVTNKSRSKSLLWTRDSPDKESPCRPTALFPTVSIIDIGEPVGDSNAREEWLHCVPQILGARATVRRIQIDNPGLLGHPLDLGEGVVAEIVTGRGYVIGNSSQIDLANSPNEMSISVVVSTRDGFDFLVTGDLIGRKYGSEDALLEDALAHALSNRKVDLEVLRVGHHGGPNATSPGFIKELKPEVALISVGNNRHGHPHCDTLETLEDLQLVIQTSGSIPDCESASPHIAHKANGTIRIDVQAEKFTVRTLPGTSSSGEPTGFSYVAACTLSGGCELRSRE